MNAITRLVQAGIRPDCAVETVAWFRQQGNDNGLERYIQKLRADIGTLFVQYELCPL